MKRWISVLLTVAMIAALAMSMSPAAFADDASTDSTVGNTKVTIPIKMTLTGTKPNPAETYDIVIAGSDCPLPGGATGSYTMKITGEGTLKLGLTTSNSGAFGQTVDAEIYFDTVGIYTYYIYQTVGANPNPKCHYDKTMYEMVVYVTNNADYTGHEVQVCIYPMKAILDSNGDAKEYEKLVDKVGEVEFINKYWVAPANTPSTGDESNVVLYALVSVFALAALTAGVVVLKRKKQ